MSESNKAQAADFDPRGASHRNNKMGTLCFGRALSRFYLVRLRFPCGRAGRATTENGIANVRRVTQFEQRGRGAWVENPQHAATWTVPGGQDMFAGNYTTNSSNQPCGVGAETSFTVK